MKVYTGTGRRKNAVAQVRLTSPGHGLCKVNKRDVNEYFPLEIYRMNAFRPLKVVKMDGQFDISIIVRGGGISGQTGAVQLGVARALVEFDSEFKSKLRGAGMMTRDPRMVERKKYGQKKARKRFQFSKR